MREICFDTETTGLNPYTGDRVIEIGCVELIDKRKTGQTFQRYINPERSVPIEAFEKISQFFPITTSFPIVTFGCNFEPSPIVTLLPIEVFEEIKTCLLIIDLLPIELNGPI